MRDEAFLQGFLEKLAKLGWTSHESAKKHARKHAPKLLMSADEYFEAAKKMRRDRGMMKKVRDSKHKGALVYWDSKTGRKLVVAPNGEIITMYNAGTRP